MHVSPFKNALEVSIVRCEHSRMTDWQDIDTKLLDPNWYPKDEYHEVFKIMRDEDPVHWTKDTRYGKDYWAITRYDDMKAVLQDDRLFSSRWRTHVPRTPKRLTPEERYAIGYDVAIAMNDNPLHDLYRRPLNKHFSVPAINRMQASVRATVDEVIGEISESGAADIVDDIALILPTKVVLRWLGVPESDWRHVHDLVWRFSAPADPKFTIDGDAIKTANDAHLQIMEYSENLAKERMAHPQDDFLSVVINSEIDGSTLSLHEITTWFFFLIAGALETTRNTISMGLWLFMRHPDQLRLMLDDTSARKGAVEEVLRWASPSRTRLRIVTEDTEWGGRDMRMGDWVILYTPSANWDERQFANPEKFDITRFPNPHLSLGEGIHYCLGRNLARLEMAELFPRVFEALPDIQLSSEPTRIPDVLGNGWSTMPVSFTPAKLKVA